MFICYVSVEFSSCHGAEKPIILPCIPQHNYSPCWPGVQPLGQGDDMCIRLDSFLLYRSKLNPELSDMTFPLPRGRETNNSPLYSPTYSPCWPGVQPLGQGDDMCIRLDSFLLYRSKLNPELSDMTFFAS